MEKTHGWPTFSQPHLSHVFIGDFAASIKGAVGACRSVGHLMISMKTRDFTNHNGRIGYYWDIIGIYYIEIYWDVWGYIQIYGYIYIYIYIEYWDIYYWDIIGIYWDIYIYILGYMGIYSDIWIYIYIYWISADPGLRQGRGGAWDHRRCGTCFVTAMAFTLSKASTQACGRLALTLSKASTQACGRKRRLHSSLQMLELLRRPLHQALWPRAPAVPALQPAVCLHIDSVLRAFKPAVCQASNP